MVKIVNENEVMYHIGLSKQMLEGAEYVLLPGDPKRSELLAKNFDPHAKFLADVREHVSYLANFYGHKILVCSSGLGGPNIGITMEELAVLGLKYFLRVGTTGGIQPKISLGDIIVSVAAVRLDGTSLDYAPINYPAVADLEFTNAMINGIQTLALPFHAGITASTDTFWQGQERYDSYTQYLLRNKRGAMEEWKHLNVLNFEMETATLFVIASVMGVKAASICGVVANRVESEKVAVELKYDIVEHLAKAAKAGIYSSLKSRNLLS